MRSRKIGFDVQTIAPLQRLPVCEAGEVLDKKLLRFDPFRKIGKHTQGEVAVPLQHQPEHCLPA